ncbi:hypothetical protein [Brevibacterium sp. RIT 803]|uniref:hypothetical protein n=1 Tax=Brevibacterium sp. RIT 803 TaxID=2810210 RepID=UPI00195212F8|nr:hypothetical protein [Brevibacterium sp. RIT 803]MBM6589720.1 hypothetical protein [Brevibacterium sp. RIT 803]
MQTKAVSSTTAAMESVDLALTAPTTEDVTTVDMTTEDVTTALAADAEVWAGWSGLPSTTGSQRDTCAVPGPERSRAQGSQCSVALEH